jgi:UBX domain-containing protein 1
MTRNRERPADEDEDEAPAQSSAFAGRAQTLGGDDAPSRVVEDPNAVAAPTNTRPSLPRVSRTLHLWQDGFSIDDGELHRFDDPQNAPVLALINQGRAPLALLGVQPGQEVDLQLDPHKDEKYVQPKKQYKPFGGSGQRLGSPAPGPSGPSGPTPAPAAAAASSTLSTAASSAPKVDIDEAQPTVQLQIRLGDGTRLVSRFNTSHTVGDIYNFVTASSTASQSRAFTLMTTFPNKDLEDKNAKLEDLSELKRGGVVVQKWN